VTRPAEKYRYQEVLWGEEGQARVRAGRVGVFGVGGTGAAHAEILARAGVGYLRLIDRDVVDVPDLHRTHLLDERDAAEPITKAAAAARRINEINRDVRTEAEVTFVTAANVVGLARGLDVVVDGSDNFRLRYILNDAAVKAGIPMVYQGAEAGRGTTMAVVPGVGPCLRCLLPSPPALDEGGSCARVGVSPAAVAATAALGAGLTLALLRGEGDRVAGVVHHLDEPGRFSSVRARRLADCPACGRGEFDFLGMKTAGHVGRCCGGRAFEVFPEEVERLDFGGMAAGLSRGRIVKEAGGVLLVGEGKVSAVFFGDGRALIYGVSDEGAARAVYERLRGER
jgi:molybdopterin/thiamine biosynthesis adenylyltransferase